ncbi:helix-turn-helix domain-containing protein [Phascolarctobacterium succinatutens]|uniref:helix-turn-helix domain-containing protein n=1 Tax=Phascolarctobacterium succinatutens TaxID=626940 RepID=UPI002630C42E|nr:helix-turn-helix transcriptional regulator [uncultured Phascolarctobacterium sp.]
MSTINQAKIIENIKFLRVSYKLTQANFAKILNLSFQQISNLENGRRNLTLEQALLLNQIFGISVDWILGISSTPLTKDSLEFAENKLLKIMMGCFFSCETYLNDQKRHSEYSLQIRSNIIYLAYSNILDGHLVNIDYLNAQISQKPLDSEFVDMMIDESNYIGKNWQLSKLLSQEKTTPYYILSN